MNCRRQALQFCLDAVVVVVIQICNKLLFEVLHGTEFLQIQQFTFEQPEEVFYHRIVQTVSFPAHALPDALFAEHPLVLPVLVRIENILEKRKTKNPCLSEKSILDFFDKQGSSV